MNETVRIAFWIFFFKLFTAYSTQETGYLSSESSLPEFIQLIDDQPLILNESYCLEQISAKTIYRSFQGGSSRNSFFIKITWSSKNVMTSIKVESDSLNDSYCEAENKHYFYRKPLNQSAHVFPDEVHEGIRFLPIKLTCKYIVTPELDGTCRDLRLRYTTPVCVGKGICACRNVDVPGPILDGWLEKDRVVVSWSYPENFKRNITSVVIAVYSEDGINAKKLSEKKTEVTNMSKRSNTKHTQYFQLNVTSELTYRIRGYFENRANCRGNSTFFPLRSVRTRLKQNHENLIMYSMAFIFLLLFLLMCLLYFRKEHLRRICVKLIPSGFSEVAEVYDCPKNLKCKDIPLPKMIWNSPYVEQSKDPCEFNYKDLIIVKEIASGNFGIVYLAYSLVSLRGCNEFAIKQIKDKACPEETKDFMLEINMFKLVGDHPNVVKMLGYCLAPQPVTIIMEYVPFNLLTYLKTLRSKFEKRKSKTEDPVSYAQLTHSSTSTSLADYNYISQDEMESTPLNIECRNRQLEYVLDNKELEIFGLQIARGMAHLESKNIVHRDLAARNVLMDATKTLKISDFGMSRAGIYVNRSSKKFPLRWMSPEALVNRVYSNKSDVWSFGVVLWEISTLGAFPYSSLQNEEVISLLEKGGHLDRPENVKPQLHSVMVGCWAYSPDDRPSFRDLVEKMEGFCQKSNGYVEFDSLKSNYVFPPMEEDIKQKKDINV